MVTLSVMRDSGSYDDRDRLKAFLATQLVSGRLALVLGAGASVGFNFPDWESLLDNCYKHLGVARPPRVNNCERLAQFLVDNHFGGKEGKLSVTVRKMLYEGVDLSFNSLRKSDLLASIGAVAMVASKGSIARIVNFNFDKALEVYLSFFGYRVWSVDELPAWAARHDVTVYHPHGMLGPPSKVSTRPKKPRIVLTESQFRRFAGDEGALWRSFLADVFASHTCVFVGLSGRDSTLQRALKETKACHASKERGDRFWGIRFGKASERKIAKFWRENGIYNYMITDYEEIPLFFFEICQYAASQGAQIAN